MNPEKLSKLISEIIKRVDSNEQDTSAAVNNLKIFVEESLNVESKNSKANIDQFIAQIDAVSSKIDSLKLQKGENGETPVKGKHYFTKADKEELLKEMSFLIPDVIHGKDADEDSVITKVLQKINLEKGDDGYSPIKGKDYWTPEEIKDFEEDMVKRIKQELPAPSIVRVNRGGEFRKLTDTPEKYKGNELKALRLNAQGNKIEFYTPSGGGSSDWGDIGGTLSDQTDLQSELDGKADSLGVDDNYVTDAEKIVIGNTSGTNTGDQDISAKQNILAEGAFVDGDKTKLDGIGGFTMNLLELTQTTMQNHDSTADVAIEWKTQDTTNANFTHSVSTNSEQITCVTAGWLDVRYAVIYEQDGSARLNTEAYVTLNGTRVEKSVSRKTYYRGVVYGKHGDESRAFYLQVAADDVIEVHSGVAEGNTGFTLTRPMDTVPTMTNIQIRFLG